MFHGAKVPGSAPGSESSREWRFQGAKVPSWERKFLGAKVPVIGKSTAKSVYYLHSRSENDRQHSLKLPLKFWYGTFSYFLHCLLCVLYSPNPITPILSETKSMTSFEQKNVWENMFPNKKVSCTSIETDLAGLRHIFCHQLVCNLLPASCNLTKT